MFDGIEVGGVGRQKQELAASRGHQLLCGRRLVKPGVVQHDHTARRQRGQQHLFKINVHHLGVATALKHQRGDQFAPLRGGNDAGAFPPFACHRLINPFAPGGAAVFTIQAVIHATLIQVKDGVAGELFEFAPEEPALHLVARAIFYEFFLA